MFVGEVVFFVCPEKGMDKQTKELAFVCVRAVARKCSCGLMDASSKNQQREV